MTIASVSFTEGNKWRRSDGDSVFYATMADGDLLARVDRGQESFRKGDILRCRMRVQQYRAADGGLSTERTVIEVLSHQPARTHVEPTLDFDSDQ